MSLLLSNNYIKTSVFYLQISNFAKKTMIPNLFIQNAADILGATNGGLTSSKIVELCSAYAIDYNIDIPYSSLPFPADGSVPNKRTALKKNLEKFTPEQQFQIIKDLCELKQFEGNLDVRNLKYRLVTRYGHLNSSIDTINELLIDETKHWLNTYPNVLSLYQSALDKYNNGIFQRNLLDDLRLSLELLLKNILSNEKSLENQLSVLGEYSQNKGGSKELGNMFQKLVEYYSKYNNTYVKHNDNIIEEEVEFIFEITSSFMKHFIRINNRK